MSFFKRRQAHPTLIVEVDSGSVSAGLVLQRSGLVPHILYSYSLDFKPEDLAKALRYTLRKVFEGGTRAMAEERISQPVDHILVALSSVWIKPTRTTVRLGGEPLDIVEDEIVVVFGSKRGVYVKSLPALLGAVLPEDLTGEGSALVRISADITEVTPFTAGEPQDTRTKFLPFGPETLSREIERDLELGPGLASSSLNLFAQEFLGDKANQKLDKIISAQEGRWRDLWTDLKLRPGKVVLMAPEAQDLFWQTMVRGAQPESEIVSINEFKVFSKRVSWGRGEREVESLAGLALYFNSLLLTK